MVKNKTAISFLFLAVAAFAIGCNPGIIDVPPTQVTDASSYFWKNSGMATFNKIDSITGQRSTFQLSFIRIDTSAGSFIINQTGTGTTENLYCTIGTDEVSITGITQHSIIPLPVGYSIQSKKAVVSKTIPVPVKHIIAVPNTAIVVAATDAEGVFYSSDDGATWQRCNGTFGNNNVVTALAVQGSTIFAGTYQGILFYSTDGGSNWTPAATYDNGKPIIALAANPSSPALYVSTGDVVFRTENPTSTTKPSALKNTKQNLYISTIAFSKSSFDSSEILFGGNTNTSTGALLSRAWPNDPEWKPVEVSPHINKVYSLLSTPSQHVFCSGDSTIFSCDTTLIWFQDQGAGFGHGLLAYDYSSRNDPQIVITANGNFRALDENGNKTGTQLPRFSSSVIHDITVTNSKYLLATESGIFSSSVNTTTWDSSSQNLSTTRQDTVESPGDIVLLHSRSGSVAWDSSWTACTLIKNQSSLKPILITARIIGHLDSLTIGNKTDSLMNTSKTYSDVIGVRYADESLPDFGVTPYWVIYYGKNTGPLVISQMYGTKTMSRAILKP